MAKKRPANNSLETLTHEGAHRQPSKAAAELRRAQITDREASQLVLRPLN